MYFQVSDNSGFRISGLMFSIFQVHMSENDNNSVALENDQKYRDLNTNATMDEVRI
jgi:hypothetical protein